MDPAERQRREEELQELDALTAEAERRGLLQTASFYDFVRNRNPGLLEFEHVPGQIDVIDWVLDGFEARRNDEPVPTRVINGEEIEPPLYVMVNEPPRYMKSELYSRLLPAYFLRRFPELMAGIVCHTDSLALEFSEEARGNFKADGGRLKPGTEAKSRWQSADGGEIWATGVSAQFMGRGYHLGVVDDPLDPEKATSPVYQRRFRKFWPDKFLSRREPGALIFFVMQRLGTDDPVDFLWRREVGEDGADKAPMNWYVVALDEIKSTEPLGRWDGPQGLPPTCTLHPDPRDEGEVLAPSRFTPAQVRRMQRDSGPYTTASQRQQRPMRPSGDYWHREWFAHSPDPSSQLRTYKELPGTAYDGGKDWDLAFTKEEANSASAYVESYRGPGPDGEFLIYIENVDWRWLEFPELVRWIAAVGGPHYVEAKASGKSAVQTLAAHDLSAQEVQVQGDKFTRANAVQPTVANRRVLVREDVAHDLLLGERQGLLRVTAEALIGEGEGLDLNDAFVQALHRHVKIHRGKRRRVRFR